MICTRFYEKVSSADTHLPAGIRRLLNRINKAMQVNRNIERRQATLA